MNNSINTNVGALVALQSLNSINSQLNTVQNQVSTGLTVSSATDNAAVFAVAQGLRAKVSSYTAVNQGLSGARGITSVAIAAATSISNLLTNVQGTLTNLASGDLTSQQRTTYTNQLDSQIGEIQSYISRASYNGVNLLAASQGTYASSAFSAFTAPTSASVAQDVNGSQLSIRANNLSGGTNGTDGWLGLSRLIYATAGGATNDTIASYGVSTGFTLRSQIDQYQAQAALADTSNVSAYYSAGGTTATAGVFSGAWQSFNNQVNTALGNLGADDNNIQFQVNFNTSLSNAVTTGLGNLVDADLAQASAQLQSLQTKQQLATQTLSIANQAPSIILNLFKG